jgi:UDP-N-acetylglucosamine 2-epimerase (non-hydrolysing)
MRRPRERAVHAWLAASMRPMRHRCDESRAGGCRPRRHRASLPLHRMQRRTRIVAVVGTRPEAIKMAPVVHALRESGWANVRVLATGQHRELLAAALAGAGLAADVDLGLMQPGDTAVGLAAAALALRPAIAAMDPQVVIGQGDTTSVAAAAQACHGLGVDFAHVEAGLRSGDLLQPYPEEQNRVFIATVAAIHFAPTTLARANLLREGVDPAAIHVTGNTSIDALHAVVARLGPPSPRTDGRRTVLVTAHRRESFGAPLLAICKAVRRLAARGDVEIVWPVHPNPAVHGPVRAALAGVVNVTLCPPLDHAQLVAAMRQATIVLTDSGGMQEEAPGLGKPLLVLREVTERPEGVACGVARLVGCDADRIVAEAHRLLDDPAAHAAMATGANPYGDGRAGARIAAVLRSWLAARRAP